MCPNGITNPSWDKIYLTGFMGVGKTTLGFALAQDLGWRFFDSDQWIEAQEKLSVTEIFRFKGENYFREQETRAIQQISCESSIVVALGGGAVLRPENRTLVDATGLRIYLKASVDTLMGRLSLNPGTRPLLKTPQMMGSLLRDRAACYESAPLALDTDGKSVADLVKDLLLIPFHKTVLQGTV